MNKKISTLDKIRKEIKLNKREQKGNGNFIVEKYIKRNRSSSPLIRIKNLDDSFEFKKFVYNEFGNMHNEFSHINTALNDLKDEMTKLSDKNDYILLVSGLDKGLFRNDFKTKKIISDYMNKIVDKIANNNKDRDSGFSNILNKKERKINDKNKSNSVVQKKLNQPLPKNENNFNFNINLQKKTNLNYLNRRNKGNKTVSANIKNKPPFDILKSNSQSQNHSIRSGNSIHLDNIIHLNNNLQKAGELSFQYSERLEKKNYEYSDKKLQNKKKTYQRKNIVNPKVIKKENNSLYFKYNQQQNVSNNSNNNPFKNTYSKDSSSSSKRNGKK